MITPPIPWDHWRSFAAVAEHGSLSAAARALGLTQPTLSRHVDLLEEALGAKLFLRAPQGTDLTDLGHDLLPEARAMVAAAGALERTASAPIGEMRGTVRLAASEMIGTEVLPGVLAPLIAAHPGLTVELVLSNRNEDLLRRAADLAVRMVRPTQSGLVARKIAELRFGLYAHRAYLKQHGTPRVPADLAGHALIGPDRDAGALAAYAAVGIARKMLRFRCDSDSAQLNALRAGLGIGAAARGVAARHIELTPVLPGAFGPVLECWLAMHADLRGSARVRLVNEHLTRHLPRALAG